MLYYLATTNPAKIEGKKLYCVGFSLLGGNLPQPAKNLLIPLSHPHLEKFCPSIDCPYQICIPPFPPKVNPPQLNNTFQFITQ